MKKLLLIIVCLTLSNLSLLGQSRILDIDNPILSIDVSYSLNKNLVVTILLNSKENSQTIPNSTKVNFNASIEGVINWKSPKGKSEERIVSGTFSNSSRETPFRFSAVIKRGEGYFIPKKIEEEWGYIENVKIKYEIDGQYGELPFIKIYPPIESIVKDEKTIEILNQGIYTSDNTGQISLKSPDGAAFEVLEISVVRITSGGRNELIISKERLGERRYANNGQINLKFNLESKLDESNTTYKVKTKVKVINTKEILMSNLTDVIFKDERPLKIWNRPASYSLTIADKNEILDSDINITGKGELNILFATKEYSDKIRVVPIKNGPNYSFKLEGLNELPNKSFSYFYYTCDGKPISPPHLISKEAPILTGFKFIGVDDHKLSMEFYLPSFVNKDLINVSITGEEGEAINVTGSIVSGIKVDNGKSKFKIDLPNGIIDLVTKDTLRDLNFSIIYNSNTVYSLGVILFNQKMLNDKISDLVAITVDKSKHRKKEEIRKIVNDIVEISKVVGNSVENKEIMDAVDKLKYGDKQEVKNVMSDIGKWGLIVGKIILPVLI